MNSFPSFVVVTPGSAECAAFKTLETMLVLGLLFPNAALVVFAIYMHKYIDRRDVAVAQAVVHLKERMLKGEGRLVDALEKIVARIK